MQTKKGDVPQSATLSFIGFVNIQKLSIRDYDFNKKRMALWGTSPATPATFVYSALFSFLWGSRI
jgi:hypothetical protein